ncbi:MAG: hypothetical protein AMS17_08225 [Spirochaetes bacterium DG_61]|jgi:hypothetical protein|nr:MAG: hypothetical protein AMS17_08225 [Spirochaetes bacterium DG_61]
MDATETETCRIEYLKNWIKACLYRYLAGKGSHETIARDIHKAKNFGITKAIFQVIIDSLPFDKASDRFKDIIMILRKDCV